MYVQTNQNLTHGKFFYQGFDIVTKVLLSLNCINSESLVLRTCSYGLEQCFVYTYPAFGIVTFIALLCFYFQGWHSVAEPMMLPEDFGREDLIKHAPYLSRITAIMKHSKNFILKCLTDEDGQNYMKWLFEVGPCLA